MSKKAHEDVDTVIERNETTGQGVNTVTECVDTVCECEHNAPKTDVEAMTDEEKARLSEQTINKIVEEILAMNPNPSPQRTNDGKYTLGKMLGLDDQYYFYKAEEADTGKAVHLMTLRRLSANERIQAEMKTESRASRCAYDCCIEDGKSQIPVLRWLSPEDAAKKRSISYLISYQDRGVSFDRWTERYPSMSEASAVALTIELLGALEGLHSGRHSDYMGKEEAGRPMVHRLVHPGSIRILQSKDEAAPHLLLTDFYGATFAGHVDYSIDTVDFPAPCSPHFACREQLLGKPPRQAWDVWGAAACLYYFLTGKTVRRFPTGMYPAASLVNAPVIPINEQGRTISTPRLAEIIDGALNWENGLRYETAHELKAALLSCIAPDGLD